MMKPPLLSWIATVGVLALADDRSPRMAVAASNPMTHNRANPSIVISIELGTEERGPHFASVATLLRQPPTPSATIRKEIAAVELALGPTFSDTESY
jgi:hypothetical protein